MDTSSTSALVALVTIGSVALGEDDVLEKVVFTDPNWGYPAFFVAAPSGTLASMVPAVHKFCSDTEKAQEKSDALWLENANNSDELREVEKKWAPAFEEYWICEEGSLTYFVGMTGQAEMTKWGYVCSGSPGTDDQKYFAEFMLKEWARCVAIDWDEESRVHVLNVASDA